jgi:hypothetical protein
MLWMLVIILLIFWVLGFGLSIGGGTIHLLLVIALLVILYRVFLGERL